MKVNSRVENIFCRIDFKQNLCIDERTAEKAGMEFKTNLLGFLYTHPASGVKMIVYSSGEVFCYGAKNDEEIESSFWGIKSKLKEAGLNVKLTDEIEIDVENLLATGDIRDYLPDLEIDLESISMKENAVYEPGKFPGVFLTFFLRESKGTAIVFKSGKVLIGDVKSHEDANLVLEKVIDAVRC